MHCPFGEPGESWQPAPGARRGKVEFCGASGVVACVHVWRAVVLVVGGQGGGRCRVFECGLVGDFSGYTIVSAWPW